MTTGKAALFRALHTGDPLLLANSWDVASARIAEAAGARAIATTSAGVAWSLGAPDGDRLDRDSALALIARIAAAVEVPVTADLESGYAGTPDGVTETVSRALEAGAVGINLEDGTRPVDDQCARIAAAREAGDEFFLNARVDTFLTGGDLESTLERATAYLAAGADGVFVPGVVAPETVSALVKGVAAPVNVMVGPGAPSVAELAALGVARISLGAAISQAAYAVVHRSTRELLTGGTYTALAGSFDYGELNRLLS
ncbi:isocitrate lyase/phosphoenolpyruvate mutase family protein [Amycolatopsis magusensis]|uniref:isocitrate lyase/phosphoenolpyruvate mutase family protein n=1 Tax=Amycolatopsis magusensis TaxID=882444 RepID=UPI0037B55EF0